MIVTSKRCFLNKFIHKFSGETIVNANYYIGDKPKDVVVPSSGVTRNEYGELETTSETFTVTNGNQSCSMYHIRYSNLLNPEPHTSRAVMGGINEQNGFKTPEELFITHLNCQDTMVGVYAFLFGHQLEGNGLQVLIFEDDENILRFGHIICQYLSKIYGVDITFIDPAYRPQCNGYTVYKGDKEYGKKACAYLMDCNMVLKFKDAVTQSEFRHNVSNIREHLLGYDVFQLMRLYNLLYPDARLPEGNYTEDQLREILIYRASAGMDTSGSGFSNVLLQFDWDTVIDRMQRESADFDEYGSDGGLF